MSQHIPEPRPDEEDSPDPLDALRRKDKDKDQDKDAEQALWDGADSDAQPITEDGTRPRQIPD